MDLLIEEELKKAVEQEEKFRQLVQQWYEWLLDNVEDIRQYIRVDQRDVRVLEFNYGEFYDWAQQNGHNVPAFPPESLLTIAKKLYAQLFNQDEPDRTVLFNMPKHIYPWQVHLEKIPVNTVVALRGIVTIAPYRSFYRLCIKATCPNEDGEEELVLACGNFWNNEEPKLPAKGCSPIDKHPLYKGIDPEVRISVLSWEMTDPPEAVEMRAPYRINVYALDATPKIALGDTLEVIGVLRAKKRGKVYEPVVEYISHRTLSEEEIARITLKDKKALQRLMAMQFPENFHALVVSYAPKLWGLWEAKALAVLSSVLRPEFDEDGRPTVLHLMLAGDRATGKSTLLQIMAKRVKPSITLSAKSVTPAGLTMGVVTLEGGQRTYQAGVIVQHKGGLVGIEEAKDNASVIEETLLDFADKGEVGRGTVAGSITVKVATTLVLTTNPVEGKWSDELTLHENLKFFGPAFLSRFIITVVRRSTGAEVYGAVLNLLTKKELEKVLPFTEEEVNGIIRQLRLLPNPPLGEKAKKELIQLMISIAKGSKRDTPVSLRDERRLKLMAQALAKIDGKPEVEPQHVRMAFEIWKAVLSTQHGMHYAETVNLSTQEEPKKADVDRDTKLIKILERLCEEQQMAGSVEGVSVSDLLRAVAQADQELYNSLLNEAKKLGKNVEYYLRRRLTAMYTHGRVYKRGDKFCTLPL